MTDSEIMQWCQTEFAPLTLATPPESIQQFITNSRRYWNTHSAYKVIRMYSFSSGTDTQAQCQVDADIKQVVTCYPSVLREELFSNHPMWVLLGFITLDRNTQDLIQLSHTFEGYRVYLGNDFRWHFERSLDNGTTPGWLYMQQMPTGASSVAVVGTKRLTDTEEIKDDYILDWIMQYTKAQVNLAEGNTMRKLPTTGLTLDGDALVAEGKASIDRLQDVLKKEGHWVLFSERA